MSRSPVKKAIVTGSGGLIGSQAARQLVASGYRVIGVDNDMRRYFFGEAGTTLPQSQRLAKDLGYDFSWRRVDIRDQHAIDNLYHDERPQLTIHCAAQPAHDWAARDPHTDFSVNAVGTLNVLEASRRWTPEATIVHISTSKVYGDNPNRLSYVENNSRYDLHEDHEYYHGITPTMSIDQCLHSLFGASKLAGDVMAQEYARYFNMPIGIFRPGCLTGEDHAGVPLHGFLSYLGKCVAQDIEYEMIGYKGKQVRDNIHAQDLVSAFIAFHDDPRPGAVYNLGGGRENSCSILEAIDAFQRISGKQLRVKYTEKPRIGDHQWFIGSEADFQRDYPSWRRVVKLDEIYERIYRRFA